MSAGEPLVTTDHVLVETWTLIRHRIHRKAAERFWERLREGVGCIEAVTAVDLEAAWEIGQDFRDQDFSLVDRSSFSVVRRLGIYRAASFDDDFAVYRFGPKRRQALQLCVDVDAVETGVLPRTA